MKMEGAYAPIPTPFRDGEIAYARLAENLARWGKSSLSGLVTLGSNGECVMLDEEEKVKFTAYVREHYPGEKPVIAGTGCESTRATIALTRKCAAVGADAVLVINPSYYKGAMTDAVLRGFYLEVAEASPVPVIIYNMPRNTGVNIPEKLIVELSRHPNIVGIKDSSGNLVQIAGVIAGADPAFSVFAGSGSFLYASLCLGATGGTMAVANILPAYCTRIIDHFRRGEHAEAKRLQFQILEANAAVTSRWGVPGLKAALDLLGYYGGEVRKPLLPLAEEQRLELKEILAGVGAL